MSHYYCGHTFTSLIMIILISHHIKSFNCILFNIHPYHDYEKPIWPRNWQLFHLQKADYGSDHHHQHHEYHHQKPHHYKHIHHYDHHHSDHDDDQEETHQEEVVPVYKHYHEFDVVHYERQDKHGDEKGHGKHNEDHGKHHHKAHVVIKHHHSPPPPLVKHVTHHHVSPKPKVIVHHVSPHPQHVTHHHHPHPLPKKLTKTTHHHHHHHHHPEPKHKVIEVKPKVVIKTYKSDKNSHKELDHHHEDVKDKHKEPGHDEEEKEGDKHKEDNDKKPETYEKMFVHEKHEVEVHDMKPEDEGKKDDKHEDHHEEGYKLEGPEEYEKHSHEEHDDGVGGGGHEEGKGGKGKKVTHVYEKKHEKVERKKDPFPHIIQTFDYQHVQKEDDKHDDGQYHGPGEDSHHKEDEPKHDDYGHDDKHDHGGKGHDDHHAKHEPDFDRKKKKYSMNHETNEGKKYEFNRNTVTRHEYEIDDAKQTTKPYTPPMHMTSVDGIYLSSTLYPDRSAVTSDAPPVFFVTEFAPGPNINNYFPDYPDVPMNYSDDDDRLLANPFLTHFHDPEDAGHRKQKAKSQVYYDQTRATNPPAQWSQFDAPAYGDGGGGGDPGVNYERGESEEVTISPISFSNFVDSLSPNFHFIPTSNEYEYDVPEELSPGVTYTGRHHHLGNNGDNQHQHHSPPQTFTYNNYYPADYGSNKNKKKKTTKIIFQTVPIEEVDHQQQDQQLYQGEDEKHDTTPAAVDDYQHDADSLDLEQQQLLGNNNNNYNHNNQNERERGEKKPEQEEDSREPIQQPVLIDVEPIVFHQLPDLLGADHGEEDPPETDQLDGEQQEDPIEPDVIHANPVDNNRNNALEGEREEERREPNESSPDEELDSFIPRRRPHHETRYTKTTGPLVNENDNSFEYGNHFSYDDESGGEGGDSENPNDEDHPLHGKPDVDFFDPEHTDEKMFAASFKDYEENSDGIQRRKTYYFALEDDFNNFFPVTSSKKKKKQKKSSTKGNPASTEEMHSKVFSESSSSMRGNQTKYRHPVSSMNTDVKAFLYSRNYDAHPDLLRQEIPNFPDSMEIKDHTFSAVFQPTTTSEGARDNLSITTHAVPEATITTQQAYHKLKNNLMSSTAESFNQSLVPGMTSPRKGKSILLERTPDPSVRRKENHRIKYDSIGSQLKELWRQEKEEEEKRKNSSKTTHSRDYPFQYTYITRKPVTTSSTTKSANSNQSHERSRGKIHEKSVRRKDSRTSVKTKTQLPLIKKAPAAVGIPESRFFDSFLTGVGNNKSVRKQHDQYTSRSPKSTTRRPQQHPLKERYQHYYLPMKKHTKQANVVVKQAPQPYLYAVDGEDIAGLLLQQQQERETTTPAPFSVTFRLPSPFDGFVTNFEPLLERAKASTRSASFSRVPVPTIRPTMPSPAFDDANFTQVRKVFELPRTRMEDSFYSIKRLDKSASSEYKGDDDTHETTKHPDPFPYQYNIEIRKRKKQVSIVQNKVPGPRGPVHYKAAASGDNDAKDGKGKGGLREGREKHVDRDLEVNKYRMVENKEEEHWHEKKWHKEDLKEEYVDGKPVPVKVHIHPKYIGQEVKEKEAAKESNLPFYARPLDAYASKEEIDQHFSVPSAGFRVDKAFESWVKKDVES